MGFTVIKNYGKPVDENTKLSQNMVYQRSGQYIEQRDLMVEFKEFEPNLNPYTLIPSTFDMGETTNFTITIFSQKEVKLEMIVGTPPPI